MTRKRRVVLIIAVLTILGLSGGGVFLYIRRGSAPAILKRAKVALDASELEKAQKAARAYIVKEPDDCE